MIKNISVTEFRAKLKEILSFVKNGHAVQITEHGKIIAEINPPRKRSKDELLKEIEKLRAGSKINGDIVSPVYDGIILSDLNKL